MADTTTPAVLEEPVILNVPVSRQLLRDLLCTAVEGGSNYWARFGRAERTADLDYLSVTIRANDGNGKRIERVVTAEQLGEGIETLALATTEDWQAAHHKFPAAGQHLANALSENGDAITADVVLQMTVFGTLIYG